MSKYNEKTTAFPLSSSTISVSNRARARTTRANLFVIRRRQLKGVLIQTLELLSLISFLLPSVWGFTWTTPSMKSMNNLSSAEELLLRSRLEKIKEGIRRDYSSLILSNAAEMKLSTKPKIPTFIFPGAGGVDGLVLELQASIPNSEIIDWKEYRGTLLTAGYDSEAVGEAIAELALKQIDRYSNINGNGKITNSGGYENKELKSSTTSSFSGIRFIGISVGGFAANAAATVIHRQIAKTSRREDAESNDDNQTLDVHLVLLDPFCGRGFLGPNYGRDNFGKYATSAIQILNTDDPVPTTNDPLPYCYCLDVTEAPEKQDFVLLPGDSMHSWPLAYFARHYYKDYQDPNLASATFPRGVVEKVS